MLTPDVFILHLKRANLVNTLSFEQLGKLLFAIYAYDGGNDIFKVFMEHEELNDPAVMVAYEMLFHDNCEFMEELKNERMD